MALQSYDFRLTFIKGKQNVLADALSRNPSCEYDSSKDEKCEATICFVLKSAPVQLKEIAEASAEDAEMSQLREAVLEGWARPSHRLLKPYYGLRREMTLKQNNGLSLICRGDTVLIPEKFRLKILEDSHQGHPGMTKMKTFLRASVYWPGMSRDIELFCRRCDACVRLGSTDKGPMKAVADQETQPWHAIAVDLTGPSDSTDGETLLTVIDLYSRFPFAVRLPSGSSKNIIIALRRIFAIFGMPVRLISDNGTPFRSAEFEEFLRVCSVQHNCSANFYPQSNGTVERFHSTLKARMRRMKYSFPDTTFEQRLQRSLYDVRSSPSESTGETPFFRLMGRDMRTTLPSLSVGQPSMPKRDLDALYSSKKGIIRSFQPGDPIYVRRGDVWGDAAVVHAKVGPCTYKIRFTNGRIAVYNQNNIKYRNADHDDDIDARIEAYEQAHRQNRTEPDSAPEKQEKASLLTSSPSTSNKDWSLSRQPDDGNDYGARASRDRQAGVSRQPRDETIPRRRGTRMRRKPAWLEECVQCIQ